MPTLRPILATTNSTKAAGGQDKKPDEFLIYVLIVVGATIFLLLIPLASFIFKVYRRKRKRKLLIERRRQLLKNQPMINVDGYDQTQGNGYGDGFHITPKNTIKPLPRCPIRKDPPDERITKIEEQDEPDFAEFQKENGLINKGFHTSENMISIHMRRSTTDLYLPSDNSLLTVAKRRYSDDLDTKSKSLLEENIAASSPSQSEPKDSPEKEDPAKGDSPDGTAIKAENSVVRIQVDDVDSSDSDDYDDVYEHVHREETASDSDSSHIYDNIDNLSPRSSVNDISDSDSEHIYSNIDDLSESDGSHIYTNLEELSEEAATLSEDDDIYENVRFRARKNSCNTETTSGDDSDSITYENTDFLNDSEVFDATESDDNSTRPIVIPRIPARQKLREELNTVGQIPPRRRYEQNRVNKEPRDQPSSPRDGGSNPQTSGNDSRETRTKTGSRSENNQARSTLQANDNNSQQRGNKPQQNGNKPQQNGNKPQQNGKKPQVRGNNLQVRGTKPQIRGTKAQIRGTKPQIRGTKSLIRGTKPQIRGTKPQETGKGPQIRGQKPRGLRQGVKKDVGVLREFRRPGVAQNKNKVASNIDTNINRQRIDSEKFV